MIDEFPKIESDKEPSTSSESPEEPEENVDNPLNLVSPFKDKEVFIHLDFKGAPPKFEFLMDFIKFICIKKFPSLITGFVFEFEDMLPFTGNLSIIRSVKYPTYTKNQIEILVKYVR